MPPSAPKISASPTPSDDLESLDDDWDESANADSDEASSGTVATAPTISKPNEVEPKPERVRTGPIDMPARPAARTTPASSPKAKRDPPPLPRRKNSRAPTLVSGQQAVPDRDPKKRSYTPVETSTTMVSAWGPEPLGDSPKPVRATGRPAISGERTTAPASPLKAAISKATAPAGPLAKDGKKAEPPRPKSSGPPSVPRPGDSAATAPSSPASSEPDTDPDSPPPSSGPPTERDLDPVASLSMETIEPLRNALQEIVNQRDAALAELVEARSNHERILEEHDVFLAELLEEHEERVQDLELQLRRAKGTPKDQRITEAPKIRIPSPAPFEMGDRPTLDLGTEHSPSNRPPGEELVQARVANEKLRARVDKLEEEHNKARSLVRRLVTQRDGAQARAEEADAKRDEADLEIGTLRARIALLQDKLGQLLQGSSGETRDTNPAPAFRSRTTPTAKPAFVVAESEATPASPPRESPTPPVRPELPHEKATPPSRPRVPGPAPAAAASDSSRQVTPAIRPSTQSLEESRGERPYSDARFARTAELEPPPELSHSVTDRPSSSSNPKPVLRDESAPETDRESTPGSYSVQSGEEEFVSVGRISSKPPRDD